jgi:probable rRNA maturation factor
MYIDRQLVLDETQYVVPSEKDIQAWADAALTQLKRTDRDWQMTVRLVEAAEIRQLNQDYRHKNGATNVLSFPFDAPPGMPEGLCEEMLGDLVICASVVQYEAKQQHKQLEAHWAHMIVHGTLHLLGYDHVIDAEAEIMESAEIAILQGLGYANPYAEAHV